MTYVFDIDGTVCSHTYGSYDEAKPDVERIKKVNELYEEGHTIVFLTARGMGRSNDSIAYAYKAFEQLTRDQLNEWGVKYHKLFLGKPSGDIYIDDKGMKDEDYFGNEICP
tara:strand:- start:8655 stop:8987 length:333 start_codon:yes stop_codon:yes gene_type:complete